MMKIVYVDMDDVLCDFMGAFKRETKRNPEIKYPQCQLDFFRKLEPVEGAIDGFNKLWDCNKYDVYILTAPSVLNPLCYMEKRLWITDYFNIKVAEKLIISPNKGLLKGDYLIDDMIQGKGQELFEGELITFRTEQYPDWGVILQKLEVY